MFAAASLSISSSYSFDAFVIYTLGLERKRRPVGQTTIWDVPETGHSRNDSLVVVVVAIYAFRHAADELTAYNHHHSRTRH